jgi:hypothetical protein
MRIEPYEILSELGRGGMGVVYRARSPEGQERAIKVLKKGASGESLARFGRESRLQSSLGEADGFVPLLDAGDSPEGPFLVMPFIAGGTLRSRLMSGRLPVEATRALGHALAQALGRAHERGIVHRDLKPENIIFTAEGRPLVADLGLAKHWKEDAPGASQSIALSKTGEFMGTAGYMAPEQMNDARSVGPPADVFSLGAILYECLAGEPAFSGDSLHGVLAKVADGRFEPLRRRRSDVPRWLARAIERALAPDLAGRYPDASAFARALAAPPPRSKVVPVLVAGACFVMPVAVALLAGRPPRPVAPDPVVAPPAPAAPTTAPPTPVPPPAPAIVFATTPALAFAAGGGVIHGIAISPGGDLVAAACADAKVHVFALKDGAPLRTLEGCEGEVTTVAFSPRGDFVAAGGFDFWARLWAGTETAFSHMIVNADRVTCVAFSPDGAQLAVASREGFVRTYTVNEILPGGDSVLKTDAPPLSIAFSPDGRLLVASGEEKAIRIFSIAAKKVEKTCDGRAARIAAVAFSPRGETFASGGDDGVLRLWSLREGRELRTFTGQAAPILATAFARSGAALASGGADGTLRFFSVGDGRALAALAGHKGPIEALAFSPAGDLVASGGADGVVRVWAVPPAAR